MHFDEVLSHPTHFEHLERAEIWEAISRQEEVADDRTSEQDMFAIARRMSHQDVV